MTQKMTYQNYRRALSVALDAPASAKSAVTIAHDPTGDMTGCCFDVFGIGFDLAAQVYAPGTVFALGKRRARWNGKRLVKA